MKAFRLTLCLGFGALVIAPVWAQSKESCINCHASSDFLVTNKKLYDYFQEWRASLHGQEGISCYDCHGGDAKSTDKEKAHGKAMMPNATASAVNFENVPKTCGSCHDDQLMAYKKSNHFEHLKRENMEKRGPNCVTCHGSLNSKKLNVNTVAEVCEQCHNTKSENHPEIPEKATALLNDYNTINGFRRFIRRRGNAVEMAPYLQQLDQDILKLSTTWHYFDLEKIEKQTQKLLVSTKEKRDALLKKN